MPWPFIDHDIATGIATRSRQHCSIDWKISHIISIIIAMVQFVVIPA